jgi:hypothetical protein
MKMNKTLDDMLESKTNRIMLIIIVIVIVIGFIFYNTESFEHFRWELTTAIEDKAEKPWE